MKEIGHFSIILASTTMKVSKSNAKEIYFDKFANKDTERKNSDQQQKNPPK
jgi:hypothetical protein